jgi:hypothetical protein
MSRHLLFRLSGVFWVSVASHMYVASATLCCDYSILLAELYHHMVLHYSGFQSLYMGRGGRCMHCARYRQELLWKVRQHCLPYLQLVTLRVQAGLGTLV